MTMHENDEASSRQFVRPKQLAEEWSVSIPTVMRICEKAGIPAYYLGHGKNGTVRFLRSDIDKYVESCKTEHDCPSRSGF